ncbi:MAG: hypothetical protein VX768_02450 [Planctomycetota bacterium]|nr:hypothetical protein [Planctomycetota bacterium]
MSNNFDPYEEWLNISPAEQPADYYRLLGVKPFEPETEIIRDQADVRMEIVRKHQNGKNAKASQRLLNEIAAARSCLLNDKLRRIYDSKLKKINEEKKLPTLAAEGELLPEKSLPQNYDPFKGTANVNEAEDLLQPIEKADLWPFVVGGILVFAAIVVIIVLANGN